MKYCLILLLSISFATVSCSSSQTTDNRVATKPGANAAANLPSQANVPPQINTGTAQNVTPLEPSVGDGQVSPTDQNMPGMAAKGGKKMVDVPQTGPTPPPTRIPAGENSEMTTTMDKEGRFIETRYFKSDRVLAKAERTWLGPADSTIKYTLRNGKEFSASGANIVDMSRATIAELLANAGITPTAPKTKPSSVNDPTGAKQ